MSARSRLGLLGVMTVALGCKSRDAVVIASADGGDGADDVEPSDGGGTDGGGDGGADGDSEPVACPVVSIGSGLNHECLARTDGTAHCWGQNAEGQLGDGTILDRDTPVAVGGLPAEIVELAGGASHTCARSSQGALWCWGRNFEGQLGDGTTKSSLVPRPVTGLPTKTVQILAGAYHTCARLDDGTLWCWGNDSEGELGDGKATPVNSKIPQWVAALGSDVAQASAAGYHNCAVKTDGTAWCWGYNANGAIGDGTFQIRTSPVALTDLGSDVAEVVASGTHTCARKIGGDVFCWGNGTSGAIGDGSFGFAPTPEPVTVGPLGPVHVDRLWSMGDGVCAHRTDDKVWCWGRNDFGQLGDGGDANHAAPALADGLPRGIVQMNGGLGHGCALDARGRVLCAGHAGFGQLGDGHAIVPAPVAAAVKGGSVRAAGAGELFTCAATDSGSAACWGANGAGQLGDGTLTQRPEPTPIKGVSGVARFGLGITHGCAVRDNGTLWCWGNNLHGELGDDTRNYHLTAIQVPLVENHVVDVSAGETHTCALLTTGNMGCWGNNLTGELGTGSKTGHRLPYQVADLGFDVASMAAGGHHGCAVKKSDGTAWCWGANYLGEIGDGTTMVRVSPVAVASVGDGFVEVVAGTFFNCARRGDGSVFCWGDNRVGQQGYGVIGYSADAHEVAALSGRAAQLSAGRDHACALTVDGRVLCWGDGSFGQLGNGIRAPSASPVEVLGLPRPSVAVVAGARHSCAIGDDGVLRCWGWNGDGQLGDGQGGHRARYTPIASCTE